MHKPTLVRILSLALIGAGPLAAHAAQPADPVAIPDAYEMHDARDADAASQVARCIGGDDPRIAAFVQRARDPAESAARTELGRPDGATLAIRGGTRWACVALSPEGFPIWPVESLHGTVVPVGPAPDAVAAWRRQLMQALARTGTARGLVVFDNGAAIEVDFTAERGHAAFLHFTTTRLKKGDVDPAFLDAVVTGASDCRTVAQGLPEEGVPSKHFAIPDDRVRFPMDGEFVVVPGDAATARFAFAGTRWMSDREVLELLPGGVAKLQTSRDGRDEGTWQVDGGVLHVTVLPWGRYSFTVIGNMALTGEARRTIASRGAEDDGESRWSETFLRR